MSDRQNEVDIGIARCVLALASDSERRSCQPYGNVLRLGKLLGSMSNLLQPRYSHI